MKLRLMSALLVIVASTWTVGVSAQAKERVPKLIDCSVLPAAPECKETEPWWRCDNGTYCESQRDTYQFPDDSFAIALDTRVLFNDRAAREFDAHRVRLSLGIWIAYDLWRNPARDPWWRLALAAEAGASIEGGRSSLLGEQIATSATAHRAWVALQLRWYPELLSETSWHVRVGVGQAWLNWKMRLGGELITDDERGWWSPVGIGLTLVRLGLMLEAGRMFAASLKAKLDRLELPSTGGSGYYLRGSLVLRF